MKHAQDLAFSDLKPGFGIWISEKKLLEFF